MQVDSTPPTLKSQVQIVRTGSNARWGAILGGVLVALSSWMVLHVFGVGLGLTRTWSTIVPSVAFFAGGLVASRLAPTPNRVNRMLHGLLVWATAALVAGAAVGSIVTSVAPDAIVVPSRATDPADLDSSVRGLGLDARDLVAPINGRLHAEGKPVIRASELERILDDAIVASVRGGRLDRDMLVVALDDGSDLGAGDIDDVASEVEAQWQRAAQRADTLASRERRANLAAANATGKALAGAAIALMLGLVAAVFGALATGNRDRRRVL